MTSSTLPLDSVAAPSVSSAPTTPNPIITPAQTATGPVLAEVIAVEPSVAPPTAPVQAEDATTAEEIDIRSQVILDLAHTPIADSLALALPAVLTHIRTQRQRLDHQRRQLQAVQDEATTRLTGIEQAATDPDQRERATAPLRTEIAARAAEIARVTGEDSALLHGQGKLRTDYGEIAFDLSPFLTATDTQPHHDDDPASIAVLLPALADNPLIDPLIDGRLERAALATRIYAELHMPVPPQYARVPHVTRPSGLFGWRAALIARVSRQSPRLGWFIASPLVILVGLLFLGLAWSSATTPVVRPLLLTPTLRPGVAVTPSAAAQPPAATSSTSSSTTPIAVRAEGLRLVVPPFPTPLDSPTPQPGAAPTAAASTPVSLPPFVTAATQPHGVYYAPSLLTLPALTVSVPITRALTQETTGANGQPQIALIPPGAGELVHYGAYPGETGTLWLLGSERTVSAARRLQEKDAIVLTDRTGATYTYRVLPFSPSGQPERVIDLNTDSWLFDAPADVSTLVLVLPFPKSGSTPAAGPQSGPEDDYSTSRRLAYRAALERITPATAPPSGTPIVIPPDLYTPQPVTIPTQTAIPNIPNIPATAAPQPSPSAGVKPTPTPPMPGLPGLPDTGGRPALSPP